MFAHDATSNSWTCRALLMAGGRSERMRATTGVHKALMEIQGIPLIEWNIRALVANNFRDIVVAVPSVSAEIDAFLRGRGAELAAEAGATVACIREASPLGTIGAARVACRDADAVVVVNVDNVTTLPLRALADSHRESHADLTIASHHEPFRLPFGQLVIADGVVMEYREKPEFPVVVSSGTYVVSKAAAQLIVPDRRFDITHLFTAAKAGGLLVRAFAHSSTWIDVNDEAALRRAEEVFGGASPAQ